MSVTPMCAVVTATPEYQAALTAQGFTLKDTVEYQGQTYTHDQIAAMTDAAYQRHRGDFTIVCGGKARVNRQQQRKFKAAVRDDVAGGFGISPWTIGFGLLLGLLGGPMGLVLAVISTIFSIYLQKDLEEDPQMMAAMGAA